MVSSSRSSERTNSKKDVKVVKCPSAFPISTKSGTKRPRDGKAGVSPSEDGGVGRAKGGYGNANSRSRNQNGSGNFRNFRGSNKRKNKKGGDDSLLDWHDTVKEIRSYGATAFEGKQKRDYQDEQYFQLTGRHMKKPKTPLPIVRGLKKAAAWREAKAREEARQAGIVLPKASKAIKKSDSDYNNHGPAPSIGFMKDGFLRVKDKPGKKR